MFRHLKQSSDP